MLCCLCHQHKKSTEGGGGVVVILEHEAVIGGFKCLYHLTKKEQAHHTNYADLLELAELLGCQYFEKLKVNVNACLS